MIKANYLAQEKSVPVMGKESVPFSHTKFSSPYIKVLMHAVAWLLFFVLLMSFHRFSRSFGPERTAIPLPIVYKTAILYVLLIGLFYFNTYYTIPKLLFRKKIALFITTLLLALVTVQAINFGLSHYFNLEPKIIRAIEKRMASRPPMEITPENNTFRRFPMREPGPRIIDSFAWIASFIILGISTSLTVTRKWFVDAENQKVLEKEHLSSELSLLKNQINPHFFFNTLNNIYALTESSPPDAQAAIYTLSKMMRYMLYETENSLVLLSKEIEFIKYYIELMRLRLTDAVLVTFDYPADLGNQTIAPLIFVSFIENAFKHGVSYHEQSYVKTQLQIDGNQLQFTVQNRVLQNTKGKGMESSGIGLTNVQRRLQLLYPGRHALQIRTDNNEYLIYLTIQLS